MTIREIQLTYPSEYEDAYRKMHLVERWRREHPDDFNELTGATGSTRPGTLDLFPQYVLMYLLRKTQGIRSITWYKIANIGENVKNKDILHKRWSIMKELMEQQNFHRLQNALVNAGFSGIKGEPDLFCWEPNTCHWFFAEAKGYGDDVKEPQKEWLRICIDVLGKDTDIRLYGLYLDNRGLPRPKEIEIY